MKLTKEHIGTYVKLRDDARVFILGVIENPPDFIKYPVTGVREYGPNYWETDVLSWCVNGDYCAFGDPKDKRHKYDIVCAIEEGKATPEHVIENVTLLYDPSDVSFKQENKVSQMDLLVHSNNRIVEILDDIKNILEGDK